MGYWELLELRGRGLPRGAGVGSSWRVGAGLGGRGYPGLGAPPQAPRGESSEERGSPWGGRPARLGWARGWVGFNPTVSPPQKLHERF